MNTINDAASFNRAGQVGDSIHDVDTREEGQETAEARVKRLYKSAGGALVGWVLDEARSRGQSDVDVAAELGVTYGYLSQLKSGTRSPAHINQTVVDAIAKYLGVPGVVVKLSAGILNVSDFIFPPVSENELLDRVICKVQDDPQIRLLLPQGLLQLPSVAKKAVALMYAEVTGQDVFGCGELPNMVRLLQRAAMFHDESEGLASRKFHSIV